MAINLSVEYIHAGAPSADYPRGSFKDETAPGAGNGTPLQEKWANDWNGFFQAMLLAAGIVPSGAPDTARNSQYLQALRNLMWSPGDCKACFYDTPDPGWLEVNGQTIGDADSGATARANADTTALFARLWALSPLQLYDAAGAAVARGIAAADDFAAHRRMALPDPRGRVLRVWDHGAGVDVGRLLGSNQEDAQQNITGSFGADDGMGSSLGGAFYNGGALNYDANSSGGSGFICKFDASRIVSFRAASEVRAKSTAVMLVIKL